MLKRALLAGICLFLTCQTAGVLQAAEPKLSKQQQIADLDSQIEELEKAKIGLEGKAIKLENQGQRLQFQEGYLQDAKRAFRAAAEFRENAKQIQQQIDDLQVKREALAGAKKPPLSKNSQSQ